MPRPDHGVALQAAFGNFATGVSRRSPPANLIQWSDQFSLHTRFTQSLAAQFKSPLSQVPLPRVIHV